MVSTSKPGGKALPSIIDSTDFRSRVFIVRFDSLVNAVAAERALDSILDVEVRWISEPGFLTAISGEAHKQASIMFDSNTDRLILAAPTMNRPTSLLIVDIRGRTVFGGTYFCASMPACVIHLDANLAAGRYFARFGTASYSIIVAR